MNEKVVLKTKQNFLELSDVAGDKVLINLENVNYLRVDDDKLKILFVNDDRECTFNTFTREELLEKINKKKLG